MAEELVRKTISLSPEVYTKGLMMAARRGFKKSFSAYCAWLIERHYESIQRGTASDKSLKVAEAPDDNGDPPEPPSKKIGFDARKKVLLLPQNKWDGDNAKIQRVR